MSEALDAAASAEAMHTALASTVRVLQDGGKGRA